MRTQRDEQIIYLKRIVNTDTLMHLDNMRDAAHSAVDGPEFTEIMDDLDRSYLALKSGLLNLRSQYLEK